MQGRGRGAILSQVNRQHRYRVILRALQLGAVVASASGAAWAGGPSPTEPPREQFEAKGEVLVDFEDDVGESDLSSLFARLSARATPTPLAADTKSYVLDVAPARVDELLRELGKDSRVEIVEPNHRVRALFVPDDPLLSEQWHLARVGAQRAWDFSTGRGVTVAVVDTGIACQSFGPFTKASDLSDTKCVAGFDFVNRRSDVADDNGHGTHVAGTIAQSTNNGVGAAGLAFGARLMPVKVLNAQGWGTFASVADGIRFAANHHADVINLSLGGPFVSRAVEKAIRHARSKGVVVVAAAGNSGGAVEFPGRSESAIGVSATDDADHLARFSCRGEGVDLAAPGVGVLQQSVCDGGKNACELYPSWSGTSMAAPHVAGAAALLASMGVTRPAAVERILYATANSVDDREAAAGFGHGLLDVGAAVQRAALRKVLSRTLSLAVLIYVVFRGLRRRRAATASPWTPGFLFTALLTGPGLLFFAPFWLPRTGLAVDWLSRPLADWDLLLGTQLHAALPLANVFVPLGITLLLLGARGSRLPLAGLSLGTASYLFAEVLLQDLAFPLGAAAFTVWAGLNAVLCVLLARLVLARAS